MMKPAREKLSVIIYFTALFFPFYLLWAQSSLGASLRPKLKEYEAKGQKDPFKGKEIIGVKKEEAPQGEPSRPLPALTIQGLVWGGAFPQAIINNRVVKVGDIIEEAKITAISKTGVKVVFDKREYDLSSPASVNISNSFKNRKKEESDER
ncbi:MAG: hypothetical protein JW788_05875 [Candidatus Omnitrophica bacterium]|nr:hypothetical protein [Candidatus Omnitrophota bacterium]